MPTPHFEIIPDYYIDIGLSIPKMTINNDGWSYMPFAAEKTGDYLNFFGEVPTATRYFFEIGKFFRDDLRDWQVQLVSSDLQYSTDQAGTRALRISLADDANDDKTVAALKAVVDAIKPYDDTEVQAKLKALADNEAIDDQFAADLKAVVDAIKMPDLRDYAKKSEIPSSVVPKAEIEAVFDNLPAPAPMIAPITMNGATLVTGVTGSVMVNNGVVHSFGRTNTDIPPKLLWDGTLSISPTTGACKVRWAITSAIVPTIAEVSIDGAAALQANNTGFGWSSVTPAIAVFTDGGYTWFEVAVPAKGIGPTTVKVTIPTGRGQLPTIYSADAITSLKPDNPTGLILRAMPGGESLTYKPNELAKKADIPLPYDADPLTARVVALESRTLPNVARLVAWATDGNLTTQMNAAHPAGGTFKSYLLASEGNACDFTIGNNTTASAFKTELGVPQTHRLARVKSGLMDALIDNASNIPGGIYRVYVTGDLVRMIALDSADPATTTTLATGLVSGLTYSTSSTAFADISGATLTVPANTKAVIGYQVTPNRVSAGQTRFRIVDSAGAVVPDTLGAAPTFTSNYDAATVTVDAEVTTGASAVTYKLQVLSNNSSATSNAGTGVNKFYYRQLR